MNASNFGGWFQILMGLFGLAQQAYQLYSGMPMDVVHVTTAAALVGSGVAHASNDKKPS